MTDTDRPQFDQGLDALARILHLAPLDDEAKSVYFKALKGHSLMGFIKGIAQVVQNYRPFGKDDFPVPVELSESIVSAMDPPDWSKESRTSDEVKASYRRRGVLIGDEARRRIEAERAKSEEGV